MEINYIGHSTVELVEGDIRVLIDPFLKPNNPAAKITADEVDPTHVFITHAHADHFADAVAVGKRTGASFVAITELANVLNAEGIEDAADANLGGIVTYDWGWVKLVQAFHTSTVPGSSEAPYSPGPGTVIGAACGVIVNIGGKTLYHLGDTALVQRPEADRGEDPGRRRVHPDRGPLHDAPRGRRRGRRIRRRRDRHPGPLQHLPADRDRRRGVQEGRRVEDLIEGRRDGAGGQPLAPSRPEDRGGTRPSGPSNRERPSRCPPAGRRGPSGCAC